MHSGELQKTYGKWPCQTQTRLYLWWVFEFTKIYTTLTIHISFVYCSYKSGNLCSIMIYTHQYSKCGDFYCLLLMILLHLLSIIWKTFNINHDSIFPIVLFVIWKVKNYLETLLLLILVFRCSILTELSANSPRVRLSTDEINYNKLN